MARYGGGEENFAEQERQLNAMADKLSSIAAKETQAAAAMEDLGAATEQAAVRRTTLNRAKKEGADITAREEAVANQETATVNLSTEAIEANRIARERHAAAVRAEQVNLSRAFRGAQDPLFAAASASDATSQAALRQQFGIGQARARALQEARSAPFLAPGNAGATAPFTQAQNAQIELTQAERSLAQANRALASLKSRSAAVTDQEIASAIAQRDAAQLSVTAARAELQSVEQLTAARKEAAVAVSREAEAAVVGGPGTALVRTASYGQMRAGDIEGPPLGPTRGILAAGQAQAAQEAAAAEARAAEAMRARVAAAEAEASALNVLTRGEREYMATLSQEGREAVIVNRENAALATSQIEQRSIANAGALQREGAALGSVSQAMYKHGALTQEFVLAASRGEVTLRELGNQALVTAGKFGGWTAAATAVFGVARALGDVAKGAIAAQSGQQNLARFIPGQTQDQTSRGFIQVSREVNAPIEDVSNAQQTFARVFHDQADSLTATSTALKAYKLDQITAADSTRYFTSITQEFGLHASQLPGLFDQISAAQRRMGARVAETLPAVARSAAAVKNAGGDLTQLVALTATAQVASGQTGNVVGTAFSRAASNFSRKPENQKIIESFGIDANQSFTQMLIDAVRRAQTLSGAQRTELAKAIGGPQYGGRIFQSLLGQQDRLTRAQDIVDPAHAAGSANEELAKKLQGADEMVKRLGTDLQQLGVALAQTGAFDFAGLTLKGADQLLHTVVQLVSLFNDIPKPLREGLSVLAEMAVTVKLLQRFAPASLLNTSVGRAIGGPELGLRQRVLRGLRDTQGGLRNQAERAQLASFNAQAASSTANLRADRAVEEANAARVASATGDAAAGERVAVAEAELQRANAQAARLAERAAAAAQEAADMATLAAAADEQYTLAKGMSVKALREADVYAARELGVPNYAGVARVGRGTPPTILPAGVGAAEAGAGEAGAQLGAEEAAQVESRADRMRRSVSNWATSWRAGAANLEETSVVAGRGVAVGVGAVEKAANTGIAAGAAMAGKVSGAGGSLKRFAGALGPLDIALGAFIGLEALNSALDGINKTVNAADDSLGRFNSTDPNRLKQQAAGLRLGGAFSSNRLRDAAQYFNEVVNPLQIGHTISAELGGTYETPMARRARLQAEAAQQVASADLVKRLQDQHEAAGTAIPLQTYTQLQQRVDNDAQLRRDGIISQREFDRRMAKHAIEAKTLNLSNLPLKQQRADIQAANALIATANLGSPGSNYSSSLDGLDDKGLQSQAQAIAARITDLGATSRDFDHLASVYMHQVNFYSGASSSSGIAALSAARQAYYKAITDTVQAELKASTGAGSTEQGRQAAFSRAASEYRQHILDLPRSHLTDLRSHLADAEQAQRRAQGDLSLSRPDNAFGLGGLGILPGEQSGTLKDAADAADKRVRNLKSRIGRINDEVKAGEREYRQLLSDLRDSRFQDRSSSRQTDLSLEQSQTTDPATQAREAVREAQAQVADAAKTYGAGTDPWKQAVTALNNARHSLSQSITSDAGQIIQAEIALAQAQAGNDPLAQARAAQAGARRLLGVAKTRLDRLQAQTALVQADQQVSDAIKAQNDARFTYLEALTTDPVTQARLETRRTQSDIAGTTGAANLTARADHLKAIQAERDARLQAREGTIDFEQTMGQITIQDAVARYQDLLKIRHLTEQQRRDILTKIHALQQQSSSEASGFNLDVTGIKMPTALDVKRAFDPLRRHVRDSQRAILEASGIQASDITNNVSHLYDARSQVQAHVQVIVNDKHAASEVYSAIDKALGTNVRARMRSRGLRG